jgi:VCBS repeat-containing protein
VVLTATDGEGTVVTQSFTVTVNNVNDAPSVTTSEVTSVNEDVTYSYTFTASDVDVGDSLTYAATSKPDWLSFNTVTGVLSGTPLNSNVGTHTVVLTATDGEGTVVTQSFTVTVNNVNDAPSVTTTQITTIDEDSAYSYAFAASDVDSGDTLTYAATTLPSWLSFNTSTGVLSGTPTNSYVGSHPVVLKATDDAGVTATQSFTVTVSNTNDDPTLTVTNGTVTEDSGTYTASGTLNGADVDVGATLSYAVTNATGSYGSMALNTSTGAYTYTMDNTNTTVQELNGSQTLTENFTVSVSDGTSTTSQTLSFVITGANDAPVSLALSANSIAENSEGVTVGTLSASDVDGDTLTYTLASGGDNDSFEISGTTLKLKNAVTANYEANNAYNLTILASDGVASTSLTQAVNVTNVNEANTSTYTGKADTNASASLNSQNNASIENLMSGYFWGNAGSGIDLTYSFMDSNSLFSNDYNNTDKTINTDGVQDPSSVLKSTFTNILDLYSSVSLLTFEEVTESNNEVGHLRVGTTRVENSAFAWLPHQDWDASGDIWLNSTNDSFRNQDTLMDGTYYNQTIIHEVGHSLGLAHTQDASSYGGTTYGTDTTYGGVNNANPYSTMAYAEYDGQYISGYSNNQFSRPTTLMIDDIAALQHLYGVNNQHNATDTTYTLNSFNNGTYNASFGDNFIYASIWDAGGTDTFSWADQSTIASINLNAGSFSSFGNITGPDDIDLENESMLDGDGILGIAYDAIIENAIGGSNIDTLVGNEVANTLYGGAGIGVKDTLTGHGGADIFVSCMADSNTVLAVADTISDFTNGTDFIGLEDWSLSDLSWSNISGGTLIAHKTNNNIMFFLDGIDASLIDDDDFIATDFV